MRVIECLVEPREAEADTLEENGDVTVYRVVPTLLDPTPRPRMSSPASTWSLNDRDGLR